MTDEKSLPQPVHPLPQSLPKKTWAVPEVTVIALGQTLNQVGIDADGDAALATDS